jgi:hypothetical protein
MAIATQVGFAIAAFIALIWIDADVLKDPELDTVVMMLIGMT